MLAVDITKHIAVTIFMLRGSYWCLDICQGWLNQISPDQSCEDSSYSGSQMTRPWKENISKKIVSKRIIRLHKFWLRTDSPPYWSLRFRAIVHQIYVYRETAWHFQIWIKGCLIIRLSSDHSLVCWCCFILFLNCKLYSVSRARLAHKTNSHWSHRCESKTFEVRIGVSLCMINREGESRKRWRRSQVRLIHGWLIRAFYGQARNVVQ